MFYTDNPVRDEARYYAEREAELERLPKCVECDNHIQEEHCYLINDELICPECLEKNYKKWVEDFMD